jgi:myo-inositol 2-dehydrogenase/D-chiro-inositol 1-dehydrogenase
VKLVMIGCGEHAGIAHGPAQARYAAQHADLALAACCDVDAARAERHRARFGFARAYTDLETMLERERPDAAVLAVPVEWTAKLAALVLGARIPLLLEKPPGRTVDEVDALIAAAERDGASPVLHQVAFNRRFAPIVREAHRWCVALGPPEAVQHVHYEMTRVDRRDADFSTTAIHGLDAVRFLTRSDYAHARFRYRDRTDLGPTVANIFVDAVMTSGATAHLAFCPAAGAVVERATIHVDTRTLFARIPIWGPLDAPGRLQRVEGGQVQADISGDTLDDTDACVLGGFYGEYEAFLGALAAGRTPSPSLRESRQSVQIAESVRRREREFRA